MVQTWERRKLNEEIEDAFIIAAQAASNVEMKLFSGKGSIGPDLQEFYNKFNYLFRLTNQLKEMETKKEDEDLAKLKKDSEIWMQQTVANVGDIQMVQIAKNGLKLFDKYYHILMHTGVIALPTRKG
jgi:hypothetical protein